MSRLRGAVSLCRYRRSANTVYSSACFHLNNSSRDDDADAPSSPGLRANVTGRYPVCGSLRGFASTGTDAPPQLDKRTTDAVAVLKHAKLGKLRDELQQASETAPYVTKAELIKMIQSSGAADNAQDAEHTCYALSNSGQVLLYQDKAYLRPAEVAEMVLQALPDTTQDLEQKLSILHQELQPLENLKADVDQQAHRRSNMLLWAGLASVMAVWGVCFRLTFWELSWDVMEPVTYFIGSGTGIAFYIYFLVTQREFAYREWKNQMMTSLQAEGYRRKHLDLNRYQKLKKDIERYRRYLNSDTIANNVKAKAA